MPRMNGAEAASVLSTTMPEIPVVLLTLYRNVLGAALASAVGVKAILDKTDGMDKLVACVRSLLDRSTSEPSHATSPAALALKSTNLMGSIVLEEILFTLPAGILPKDEILPTVLVKHLLVF